MTTPAPQPTGNFVVFENNSKRPGDRRPAMTNGKISIPGDDKEYPFDLWATQYADKETGEMRTMFSGPVSDLPIDASPADKIAAMGRAAPDRDDVVQLGNIEIRARQLVLFTNRFKDEAPDKQRPDYWGAFYPGGGAAMVRIGAWARESKYGSYLSGQTNYPVPGKTEAQMQESFTAPTAEPAPRARKAKTAEVAR